MIIREQLVHFSVGYVVPFIAVVIDCGEWKFLPLVNLTFFFFEFLWACIVATLK
jgi:hypothetical protein